ncbi:MAG TPA: ankyrin repeat domain-containing protein [Bryobacteraceae bacterium]|jgi:ankyrin repeat protein
MLKRLAPFLFGLPLVLAAANGTTKIASSLLQANSNTKPGSAMVTAARSGKVDTLKSLLDRGADVNAKESATGQTPLMAAVLGNHRDAAEFLLERGADINASTEDGMTALLFAAREGYREIATLLLDRGADPNARDQHGRGALFFAIEARNHERSEQAASSALLETLVEKGVDVNARANPDGLSWVDFDGETPFLRAALSGDVESMRYLLEHGADPNLGTWGGTTPLMAAAGISPEQTFVRPEPEVLAALQFCLDHGAHVNAKNSDGLTALHGAANRGGESAILLLADYGAKLNARDKLGRTPLMFAEGVFLAAQPSEAKPKAIALIKELIAGRD